jgi:hypothetical protein
LRYDALVGDQEMLVEAKRKVGARGIARKEGIGESARDKHDEGSAKHVREERRSREQESEKERRKWRVSKQS